jgi:pyruvate formate lyase activating enzyme
MSVAEVMAEISRDSQFYQSTGGGITISGGEPLAQAGFVFALLREAKRNWLDTSIETCGIGKTTDYLAMLPYIDTIFMDLKSADPTLHRKWTKADNKRILDNLAQVSKAAQNSGTTFCIRIPVVSGFNDNVASIETMSQFIAMHCATTVKVELLPYHKLGRGKYHEYDRTCEVYDLEPPQSSLMNELTRILISHGIQVVEY